MSCHVLPVKLGGIQYWYFYHYYSMVVSAPAVGGCSQVFVSNLSLSVNHHMHRATQINAWPPAGSHAKFV